MIKTFFLFLSSFSLLLPLYGQNKSEISPRYGPGCPYCTPEPTVGGGDPVLQVPVKWCGLNGAPSVDDAASGSVADCGYGTGGFKTMMWRRHERPTDCIFIPQVEITLRSGSTISVSDFVALPDASFTNAADEGNIALLSDFNTNLLGCDMALMAQPKGIVAVSAQEVSNTVGGPNIIGLANLGSATDPFMAIADPDVICGGPGGCELNERTVAAMAATIFNLGPVTTGGNLMQQGGTGATLTPTQRTQIRNFLTTNSAELVEGTAWGNGNTLQEINSISTRANGEPNGFVDLLYDKELNDVQVPYLDIEKVVVSDNSHIKGNLDIHFKVRGIYPRNGSVSEFFLNLDVDNNVQTGIGGFDYQVQFKVDDGATIGGGIFIAEGEFFLPVPALDPFLSFAAKDINTIIFPFPNSGYEGPLAVPNFTEFTVSIANDILERLKLPTDGRIFPNGLGLELILLRDNEKIDELSGKLDLPEIIFPEIFLPDTASVGETISIEVKGMTPNAGLGVFVGSAYFNPNTSSDGEGNAKFQVTIPDDAITGKAFVTVGIDDPQFPNNSVTADAVIFIKGKGREEGPTASMNCPKLAAPGCEVPLVVSIDMNKVPVPNHALGNFTGTLSWDINTFELLSEPQILSGYEGVINLNKEKGELVFTGAKAEGEKGLVDILGAKFSVLKNASDGQERLKLKFSVMAAAATFKNLLPDLKIELCKIRITQKGNLGDVNIDSKVNSTDANIILTYDTGLPIPDLFLEEINEGVGDVNFDEKTNSSDALLILSKDAGLPVPFPVGGSICAPNNAQNADGEASKPSQIILISNEQDQSDIFNIAIYVDGSEAKRPLGSFSTEFTWNPQYAELIDAKGGETPGFEQPIINTEQANDGNIKLSHAIAGNQETYVHIANFQMKKIDPAESRGVSVSFSAMSSASGFENMLEEVEIIEKFESTTSLEEELSGRYLFQVYPNPFNDKVHISFNLQRSSQVFFDIIDIRGQRIFKSPVESKKVGKHTMIWDGNDAEGNQLPTGLYFLIFSFDDQIVRSKIRLINN